MRRFSLFLVVFFALAAAPQQAFAQRNVMLWRRALQGGSAPLSVRGLSIGESTLSEALERFPCQREDYTPGLMGGPLYGGPGGLWGEPGMSDQGNPDLSFRYGDSFLRLSFGEDGILRSILWSTSEYDGVTYEGEFDFGGAME